jgi:hypothetical protein
MNLTKTLLFLAVSEQTKENTPSYPKNTCESKSA